MKKKIYLLAFAAMAFSLFAMGNTSSAKMKNYTVSAKMKVKGKYKKSKNLNKYTKHYLLLRGYLEKMEKNGGGTLTLKKGTYKISNSLLVPNNVTIKFKNGVKLVKINKTGKAVYKASESMFQTITYKLGFKKKKAAGYTATQNIKFIGEGKVTMDLKNIKNAKAIIIAHCQNVEVQNIRFKHMNTGHFLEIDAAKDVLIHNCSFSDVAKKSPVNKEAINIDTPDALTGGLTLAWSKPDKTPNLNVTIENCKFKNLQRGIGTHKYSQKKINGKWALNCYHENMVIRNNTFTNIKETGIFLMDWKNTTINNNIFVNNNFCLNFRGAQAPFVVSKNNFGKSTITLAYNGKQKNINNKPYRNSQSGKEYSPILTNLGIKKIAELIAMNNKPLPAPTPAPAN